jgi:DNA (cytosine-5)-methyltransferase 1
MKVLNLYACLGGNRYKWDEVAEEAGIELQVTAVELDPELAKLYQERFPNDTVIVADAHQYLLDHYKEFDFVWSSPPCPTFISEILGN